MIQPATMIATHRTIPRKFYQRGPVRLARAVLGQRLVRVCNGERIAGRIVEVEAYLGIPDRAAHTYDGRRTARNASMWLDGGHAYVYFTYGMHHCVNIVAGLIEQPVAVLVRALEPLEAIKSMRRHRRRSKSSANKTIAPRRLRDTDLCSGPAKLCQALTIDRQLDGTDLTISKTLFIEQERDRPHRASEIVTGPRIGVAYAGDWADKPLRFYLKDNPHVSRPR